MNICEHLTATARIVPDRTAILFAGQRITFAELDRMSLAASQRLLAAQIKPGDRVAIMLPNVPAFAVWYYAALRIGAIAVSISTRAPAKEVAFLLDDCGAAFFIADEVTLEAVREELPSCVNAAEFTSEIGDAAGGQPLTIAAAAESSWFDAHPNDAAVILYTSGTTGFAKGATLSHGNVRSNVNAFNHLCHMQPDDRVLLAVPLFHCFGQNALLNSVLNVGATIVLQRRFDLNESKRLIAVERVTQLYGVPMMFQLFLESCRPDDLKSVNYCFSAAATLPLQISTQWQQKFDMPIHEGYGLTETSPFASYNHRVKFVAGSIGTPIDAVEMKIVDTQTGEDCPVGELGEIVIRGPNVMLGYWNRPADTRSAIRDGWFHSGDIGRIDERGFFFIVDRVKDMITVGGLKVFPAEVERVLLDLDCVSQVAVVGQPDDVFGEQVVAFVVLADSTDASDSTHTSDESLEFIRRHARSELANYKVPRVLVPIDELPRNPSGKVLKRELREFDVHEFSVVVDSADATPAAESSSQISEPAPTLRSPSLRKRLAATHAAGRRRAATEFVQRLVQTIAETEELPQADDGFLDAGMDSLMIVELSHQIQLELGAEHEIPATLVFDHPRLSDLSDYLLSVLYPPNDASEKDRPAASAPSPAAGNLRSEIENLSEEDALNALIRELNS